MKRTYILALVGMLCLTTCNKLPQEDNPIETVCNVQIHIQPSPEIIPFNSTRNIPGNIPSEPGASTPDGGEETPELFNTIEYVVYNTSTEEIIKQKRLKNKDSDDFGIYLYDNFAPGDYLICLLAHSNPKVLNLGDSFIFDQVGDCFYAFCNLAVELGMASQDVTLTLKRVVSRIEFQPTDKVPADASSFRIEVSGLYNTFNVLAGQADTTTQKATISHTFTDSDRQTFYKPSFMTLLPADSTKLGSVTLQTLKEETPINKQTLKNIPLFLNRTTRYTGALFTPSLALGTLELTIENEGKWGEDFELLEAKDE